MYDCAVLLMVCFSCSQAVDKADELKAQMDARGFIHSPETLSLLVNLSAEYKQNLDEALKYKQQL